MGRARRLLVWPHFVHSAWQGPGVLGTQHLLLGLHHLALDSTHTGMVGLVPEGRGSGPRDASQTPWGDRGDPRDSPVQCGSVWPGQRAPSCCWAAAEPLCSSTAVFVLPESPQTQPADTALLCGEGLPLPWCSGTVPWSVLRDNTVS